MEKRKISGLEIVFEEEQRGIVAYELTTGASVTEMCSWLGSPNLESAITYNTKIIGMYGGIKLLPILQNRTAYKRYEQRKPINYILLKITKII